MSYLVHKVFEVIVIEEGQDKVPGLKESTVHWWGEECEQIITINTGGRK